MAFQETEALTALINEVQEGWQVEILDHRQWSETRTDVTVSEVLDDRLILTSEKGWQNCGHKYNSVHFMRIGDPDIDGEREIARDRDTRGKRVAVYRAPRHSAGDPRIRLMTFVFIPPGH